MATLRRGKWSRPDRNDIAALKTLDETLSAKGFTFDATSEDIWHALEEKDESAYQPSPFSTPKRRPVAPSSVPATPIALGTADASNDTLHRRHSSSLSDTVYPADNDTVTHTVHAWVPGQWTDHFWSAPDRPQHKNWIGYDEHLGGLCLSIAIHPSARSVHAIVRSALMFCVIETDLQTMEERDLLRTLLCYYLDYVHSRWSNRTDTGTDTPAWCANSFVDRLFAQPVFPSLDVKYMAKKMTTVTSPGLAAAFYHLFEKPVSPSFVNVHVTYDNDAYSESELTKLFGYPLQSKSRPTEHRIQYKENPEARHDRIKELIATEQSYFESLTILLQTYKAHLLARGILSKDMIDQIFGNVHELYNVHEAMNADLQAYAMDTGDLGKGQQLRRFQPYEPYLAGQANGREVFNKAKNDNATFRAEVEKWSREPALKQVRLENLLIAPVQRLMRYRLLIEAILTYTPPDHREYNSLLSASKKVHTIAARLDEIKAKTQSAALLQSVLADIDQLPAELKQGGTLLANVTVEKLNVTTMEAMAQHQLLLIDDTIVLAAKEKNSLMGKSRMVFQQTWPVDSIQVRKWGRAAQDLFVLTVPSPTKDVTASVYRLATKGSAFLHDIYRAQHRTAPHLTQEKCVTVSTEDVLFFSHLTLAEEACCPDSKVSLHLGASFLEAPAPQLTAKDNAHLIALIEKRGDTYRALIKANVAMRAEDDTQIEFAELYLRPHSDFWPDMYQKVWTASSALPSATLTPPGYALFAECLEHAGLSMTQSSKNGPSSPKSSSANLATDALRHALTLRRGSVDVEEEYTVSRPASLLSAKRHSTPSLLSRKDSTRQKSPTGSLRSLKTLGEKLKTGTKSLGSSLSRSMTLASHSVLSTKRALSLIDNLMSAINAIELGEGLLQPCLYEQSGDAHMTEEMTNRLTRAAGIKNSQQTYTYEIAMALKCFVAALYKEKQILPWKQLCLLETIDHDGLASVASVLKESLTLQDRACLNVLFHHWHKLTVHSGKNYMTANRLAQQLTSSLFRLTPDAIVQLSLREMDPMVGIQRAQALTAWLIEHPAALTATTETIVQTATAKKQQPIGYAASWMKTFAQSVSPVQEEVVSTAHLSEQSSQASLLTSAFDQAATLDQEQSLAASFVTIKPKDSAQQLQHPLRMPGLPVP